MKVMMGGATSKINCLFSAVLALLTSIFIASLYFENVGALGPKWGDVYGAKSSTVVASDITGVKLRETGCVPGRVTVEHPGLVEDEDACVTTAQGVSLAVFYTAAPMSARMYAVRLPGDERHHLVLEMTGLPGNVMLLGNGDLLLSSPGQNGSPTFLRMVRVSDAASHLTPVVTYVNAEETSTYYRYTPSTAQYVRDATGALPFVRRKDVSQNQQYAVAEIYDQGIGVVDLETMRLRYIAADAVENYSSDNMRAGISDDGKVVAVVSADYSLARVYAVDDVCGSGDRALLVGRECHGVDVSDALMGLRDAGQDPFSVEVSSDGAEVYVYSVGDDDVVMRTTVYPDPSARRLDYLALGDSYSSGEGDVGGGGMYYLPGTRGPGQCHLSSRSYPFILRGWWNVERSLMSSVACSGAQVAYDYWQQSMPYLGQDERLKDYTEQGRSEAQAAALAVRSPGLVPQLEFIKRYQPKVVTLTGGGNDVGFADVLKACASPTWEMLIVNDTCAFAKNHDARRLLVNAVDNQYAIMKVTIEKIRQLSPTTKIYIIGYPQFIANPVLGCSVNAVALDRNEREMIREMVVRLNDVLSRAAYDAGAVYVDIEDSLSGGQLCQRGSYVTGLLDIGLGGDIRQLFHPNAAGHTRMAHAIHATVPSLESRTETQLRGGALSGAQYSASPTSRQAPITSSTTPVGSTNTLNVPKLTFQPGSNVWVTMFSDPTNIGEFGIGDDGGAVIDIQLPSSIYPGYHTLVITGVDDAGSPVSLYQFITVTSGVEGDMDGDGIADAQDKCPFITEWIDEITGRDACNVDGHLLDDSRNEAESNSAQTRGSDVPVVQGAYPYVASVLESKEGLATNPRRSALPESSNIYKDNHFAKRSQSGGESNVLQFFIVGLGMAILLTLLFLYSKRRYGRKTK